MMTPTDNFMHVTGGIFPPKGGNVVRSIGPNGLVIPGPDWNNHRQMTQDVGFGCRSGRYPKDWEDGPILVETRSEGGFDIQMLMVGGQAPLLVAFLPEVNKGYFFAPNNDSNLYLPTNYQQRRRLSPLLLAGLIGALIAGCSHAYGNPESVRRFPESELIGKGDVVTPFCEITGADVRYVESYLGKQAPFDFSGNHDIIDDTDVALVRGNIGMSCNHEGPTGNIQIVYKEIKRDFGSLIDTGDGDTSENKSWGDCNDFAPYAHCRLRGPRYESDFAVVSWNRIGDVILDPTENRFYHMILLVYDKKEEVWYAIDNGGLFNPVNLGNGPSCDFIRGPYDSETRALNKSSIGCGTVNVGSAIIHYDVDPCSLMGINLLEAYPPFETYGRKLRWY